MVNQVDLLGQRHHPLFVLEAVPGPHLDYPHRLPCQLWVLGFEGLREVGDSLESECLVDHRYDINYTTAKYATHLHIKQLQPMLQWTGCYNEQVASMRQDVFYHHSSAVRTSTRVCVPQAFILDMSFYSSEVRWLDFGVVCSALLINLVLGFTQLVEQYWLGLMFRVILYFIDFSIFAAIVVAQQGKGGVAVFYLFRAGFLATATTTTPTVASSLLPAVLGFCAVRAGAVVLEMQFGVAAKSSGSSKQQREQERRRLERGRSWFVGYFGVVLFISTMLITSAIKGVSTGALAAALVASLLLQLTSISSSQDYAARIIANTLHHNVYLFLVSCAALAKLGGYSYLDYFRPAFVYLAVLLLYARLYIGRTTYKFHSLDADLFYAVYPWGDAVRAKLFTREEGELRLARAVDKASRQLASIIYGLGVVMSALSANPLWLAVGLILLNVYRVEDGQSGLQGWLERKLEIRPKLHLLLPLMLFCSCFWREEQCRRELLQSSITFCGSALQRQVIACGVVSLGAVGSQVVSSRRWRNWVQKGVAVVCPLLGAWFVGWLECQVVMSLLILVYCMAMSLSIIRDDRMAAVKRGKLQ